jgi:hypothetical protein
MTWDFTVTAFINYTTPIVHEYDFNAHLIDYVLSGKEYSIDTLYNLLVE